jgi:hypothetical protein
MSSLFGSKSKVKAKGGGRLQAVKSVTVPGKCSAISDGDWTVFTFAIDVISVNGVVNINSISQRLSNTSIGKL